MLIELLATTIGSFLIAFGVNEFIVPTHLLTSGLSGICIMLFNLFHWPIGILFLVFNIPLLIIGYYTIGRKFSVYTILSVIEQAFFLSWLHIPHSVTDDPMLAAIFGGFLIGFGAGFTLRVGGSSGGFDIIARLLARRNVRFGTTNLVLNGIILLLSAALFNIELALYTFVSIFVAAKTYDIVLRNMEKVSLLIVTQMGEQVQQQLHTQLNGEITLWQSASHTDSGHPQILFCIAVNAQIAAIRTALQAVDPHAVCSILPTQDVVGGNLRTW